MPRGILKQYERDILRCVRCGTCKAVCPSFLTEVGESYSPRGRIAVIQAALDGRLGYSAIFRDRLATCFGCLSCDAACPAGVPVHSIIQAAKEQALAESGRGLLERLISAILTHETAMRSLAWLAPVLLGFGPEPKDKFPDHTRERSTPHSAPSMRRGRVAFFPGCGLDYLQQDIKMASIEVLSMIGYDVMIPKERVCCGMPLLSLGDKEAAEKSALANAGILSELGVEAVVTACASCGLTFKSEYPKLLPPDVGIPQVFDIHEILDASLPAGIKSQEPVYATIHDPCHLGRGQGLSQTMRSVIRSINGITLIEMKQPDRCCGFGGVMRAAHKGPSRRIGAEKAKDIIRTGAHTTITGCPACRLQIKDSLRMAGSGISVLHTVQLVADVLKESRFSADEGRLTATVLQRSG